MGAVPEGLPARIHARGQVQAHDREEHAEAAVADLGRLAALDATHPGARDACGCRHIQLPKAERKARFTQLSPELSQRTTGASRPTVSMAFLKSHPETMLSTTSRRLIRGRPG